MGQHRIQRQVLQNFSIKGRQLNSREIWCLNPDDYKPNPRSIRRVGFFQVDCSHAVDQYITSLEDKFKDTLGRFSRQEFVETDVGRETYNFIAMHYVRSQACRRQIEHIVGICWRDLGLPQPEAEAEYNRLTRLQDVPTFRDLVDCTASALTHYIMYPMITTGPCRFITSDKIMQASTVKSGKRQTFLWFPLSASVGMCLISDGHVGQILGPNVMVDHEAGQIIFAKQPEAEMLRCQMPRPQEDAPEFVNELNSMMVVGSNGLYAADPEDIDAALLSAAQPTGYRYRPATIARRSEDL